ncbi:MAG TPA: NAD(P)/FAD-dependent oxidoreductase [Pyrinomonadaceae bacterium]|nr:NAD(P)/FAD-dependent oxidoreductase [Pyrinomonadaceae bacterium]
MTRSNVYDVSIAGGGPAGTSAAIHLAQEGFRVLLAEQKKFPREKLCGEFISPECVRHFEQLGVASDIATVGGAALIETSFYSRGGKQVTVPTKWFENNWTAIGLSRAEMDLVLLERAKQVGVTVLEDAPVVDLILESQRVTGMRVRVNEQIAEYHSRLTIDATGRTRALGRKISEGNGHQRARLVAFKAHLRNARVASGACEIYFYRGGYGGLNSIEGGLSNLCFIASARDVRRYGSDIDLVFKSTILQNLRAAFTLGEIELATDWLSVALESFGRHKLVPAEGLLMVGDAAAFIDPFTGSGMLMALESGAIASQSISESRDHFANESSFSELADRYRSNYEQTFNSRLRVSGWLRRAAFIPRLAETAIIFFGFSDSMRRKVAQATRRPASRKTSLKPLHDVRKSP